MYSFNEIFRMQSNGKSLTASPAHQALAAVTATTAQGTLAQNQTQREADYGQYEEGHSE